MGDGVSEGDRYIWLLSHMGRVEAEARKWTPARDKPLLLHLHDFIGREAEKTGHIFIARQRNLLKARGETGERGE